MIISPSQKCAINVWCMFHPGIRLLNINVKRNHNRVVLLIKKWVDTAGLSFCFSKYAQRILKKENCKYFKHRRMLFACKACAFMLKEIHENVFTLRPSKM